MCFLCLKDDPFAVKPLTDIQRKRQRAAEIKKLLREAEGYNVCDIGDATVNRLKEEQYRLSREL